LDVILVKQGYAQSREKARAMILSGKVYVNGRKEDKKAGTAFDPVEIQLEVRDSGLKYVSRGGLKLEKAIAVWELALIDRVCMDIGASTGGFTDCMLQNGAAKVYSVDEGRGQLAQKLRDDKRVICMEQTNFRYMAQEDISEKPDFASVDVSFISLTKILIPARNLLKEGGELVCLVKPQFEAGREKVGKNGVVREAWTHREVIAKIIDYADSIGFTALHLDYSPVRGAEGNIEYLLHLKKEKEPEEEIKGLSEQEAERALKGIIEEKTGLSRETQWQEMIEKVVEESHQNIAAPTQKSFGMED